MVACRSPLATTRTRWRAGEAVPLDVPAGGGEHLVTGRRQTDRVGRLRSGDETDGDAGGKSEQVSEPVARDLLDDGGRGRRQIVVGRLVPGRHEQLGGRGGGEGATDDEPEVAGTGRGDDGRLDTGDQLIDDDGGRRGVLGHGAADGGAHIVQIDGRKDRCVGGAAAVLGHVGRRAGEQRTEVFGHAARLSPSPSSTRRDGGADAGGARSPEGLDLAAPTCPRQPAHAGRPIATRATDVPTSDASSAVRSTGSGAQRGRSVRSPHGSDAGPRDTGPHVRQPGGSGGLGHGPARSATEGAPGA